MITFAPHRPSGREADEWDEHYRDDRIDRSRVDAVATQLVVGPPIVEDGVIFEAQRRARRRRTAILIAASALAIAAGTFAMFAGSSMVSNQGSELGGEASGFSAPVDEAEIVAEWSKLHVGWVYVYDDGRVVWYPDSHASLREGTEPLQGILVQRLTPNGLELVRAGVIEPSTLLGGRQELPIDVWSDLTPDEYLPSKYALCLTDETGRVGAIGDVGAIRDRLPLDLQTLLRGTERTFTHYDNGARAGAGAGAYYGTGPGPGVDCFVLSPEQAGAVWARGDPRDQAMMLLDDTSYATLTASDGAEFEVVFGPVLPDGGWVQSGG